MIDSAMDSTPVEGPAIVSWARSAIAPMGGAFNALHAHEIAAPVLHALLQRARVHGDQVDAIVLGNALGAGGNPARMTALAAGLPARCAAFTVDSQCCAGLDAVAMGVGLIASGQAEIVIAGGVEAWSRAPIRQTRPLHATDVPIAYERPPFAPRPEDDPDLLQAAAEHAHMRGYSREQQDAYALLSHTRALQSRAQSLVAIDDCKSDLYPRHIEPARAARMPVIAHAGADPDKRAGLTALTISAKADGAAMVLLASQRACERLGLNPSAQWLCSASVGADPRMPLAAAAIAARKALRMTSSHLGVSTLRATDMQAIELHDAFASQGLSFCEELGLQPEDINTHGGGLARGHPIGASGAVALSCLLDTLQSQASIQAQRTHSGDLTGLAAIAGAGGLGAACVVQLHARKAP